ncbi:ABC transporter permease [Novosphingobium piscinae]|uniref:FtsX-like permease family protein n=1 Tax=Novosphingobium piscinae TaxID=1507448 RepID=A0A7X1FVX8_9SPHN|nr:FtsX-like permease family protein [Novosphingobium piscinae]MBC2667960.1 FtsX-like permease family protein [Novosphingobium piscinae]
MTIPTPPPLPWSRAWRIARRDLSTRFKGLRLLLTCLFLGVAALAAIGSLTGSIERELATRGRAILGGDIGLEVWQRALTPDERAALAALGRVSLGVRMQAMASAGDLTAPVQLKAVDRNWPLVGRLRLSDGRLVGAPPPGQAWLAEGAAERLGLAPGQRFTIAGRPLTVGGIIADEPDRLGEGFAWGPPVIVADSFPAAAGLTAPGAQFRTRARVAFARPYDPAEAADSLKRRFPQSGLALRTRDNAAPGTERFVERMGEFLVLVGLAALVIAGIGIGLGVSSYLEGRRTSIATLKVLGATGADIARITLLQVGAAALAATLAGLVVGVLVTPLLGAALGDLLPLTPGVVIDPAALARAAAYGLLVALVFTAGPLAAARAFPAMALMRARVDPLRQAWRGAAWPIGLGLAALVALALATAAQPLVTLGFLGGAAATLALLASLGVLLRRVVAVMPRPRQPLLRTALANLHRPGAQTVALVTALGFGLSAFVLLAAVQSSLDANIAARVPQRAPDFFVLDVPRDRAAAFRAAVDRTAPGAQVRMVPNLRGAILAYGPAGRMVRVADLKAIPEDAWALRGERGLTYAAAVPEGNVLTAGEWWPADYAGPPLVSVDEKLGASLGLRLGDRIAVSVLGVEREARIASFRRIDWDSLGFNYVLVFSPNMLADAPHNLAATIDLPAGAPRGGLLRALVRAFPAASVVETGAVLKDARALLDRMSVAILAAAGVAVLAGLAVLLGAIAASRRTRTYDTAVLRVLGASRGQVLAVLLGEYAVLGLLLAVVALPLGTGVAWGIVVQLFDFEWLPSWPAIAAVLAAGLALVLGFAVAATLPVLRERPSRVLREL